MHGYLIAKTLPLRFAKFVSDYSWLFGKEVSVVEGAESAKITGLFDVPIEVVSSRLAMRLDKQPLPVVVFSFISRQRRPQTFETYEDVLTVSAMVSAADTQSQKAAELVDTIIDLLESFFLSFNDSQQSDDFSPHSVSVSEWDLPIDTIVNRNIVSAGLVVEFGVTSSRTGHILD